MRRLWPLTLGAFTLGRVVALRAPFTLATLGVTLWTCIGSLGLYTYLAELAAVRGLADSTSALINPEAGK